MGWAGATQSLARVIYAAERRDPNGVGCTGVWARSSSNKSADVGTRPARCRGPARPFRWWDSNPTGRVLNRFSEDVNVMDLAVTNILGVIFGAVLFFIGSTIVLALANPLSLALRSDKEHGGVRGRSVVRRTV